MRDVASRGSPQAQLRTITAAHTAAALAAAVSTAAHPPCVTIDCGPAPLRVRSLGCRRFVVCVVPSPGTSSIARSRQHEQNPRWIRNPRCASTSVTRLKRRRTHPTVIRSDSQMPSYPFSTSLASWLVSQSPTQSSPSSVSHEPPFAEHCTDILFRCVFKPATHVADSGHDVGRPSSRERERKTLNQQCLF